MLEVSMIFDLLTHKALTVNCMTLFIILLFFLLKLDDDSLIH
jgi:hypothetical protein